MSGTIEDKKTTAVREFPRVSSSCPVNFKIIDEAADLPNRDSGPADEAMMNNISGGGISFSSPDAVDVGKLLALEVELPGFPTSVISMGKVVWSRPSETDANRFEVGVEFWWVGWKDNEAQQKVSQFITDKLS